MIRPQVNRIRGIVALALTIACAPASNTRQTAESTAVIPGATVKAAALRRRRRPDIRQRLDQLLLGTVQIAQLRFEHIGE